MSEQSVQLTRTDPMRVHIERCGQMITDAMIFVSESISLEPDAVRQLCDAASLPPAKKVLATADIHVGFGIPIGAVLGLDTAIMPAAVGYDINCGMRLLRTPFSKGGIDTEKIALSIARDIPLGEGKSNLILDKTGLEAVVNKGVASIPTLAQRSSHPAWEAFNQDEFTDDLKRIEENGCLPSDLASVPNAAIQKGSAQLGTLGGGNHFIEIQHVQQIFDKSLAETFGLFKDQIVVMIHSGSRRFGYEIADEYMNIAAQRPEMTERKKMLSYLPTDSSAGKNYIAAMAAAANFAFTNRHIMALLVRRCFNRMFGPTPMQLVYDVPHNMAKLEPHLGTKLWVHRKGATRAFGQQRMADTIFERTGQPVIIPGSMGTASYLLVGTGNSEESLCSVNHGAGRVMSRTAALGKSRRGKIIASPLISDDQFKRSMKGIKLITADRHKIKEEAPAAYKDIDEVVRIVIECGWAKAVARMVPLAVLKG
ncbi:MAG: RtcB family protein [Phycisphaerae bacterium]|nr:RtcB family protein [Phycisphaerae bacterium]MDD5381913.1 RtcB family protein [Phycisphaerae bacterium]